MKKTQQCPKCDSRRILAVEQVRQPEWSSTNVVNLAVTARRVSGLPVPAGSFEVLICATCGYAEWYVQDIEQLEELALLRDSGVRLINADPGRQGPYR